MSSTFIQTQLYIRERLPIFPWFFIPIAIFVLGHGHGEQVSFRFPVLYTLLFGIIFFRILDDYFCKTYDLLLKKQHSYLKMQATPLLILGGVTGFLFLSTLLLVFGVQIFILALMFILMNIPFYVLLKRNENIVFISLLKYPFLFYFVMLATSMENAIWSLLGVTFFFTREIAEEKFKYRNAILESVILLSIISMKYTLRYIS